MTAIDTSFFQRIRHAAVVASAVLCCGSPGPATSLAKSTVPSSRPTLDVTQFASVDPTGETDSTEGILMAIASAPAKVVFPCGVYLISGTIPLPSNMEISGMGECSVIRTDRNFRGNANWSRLNFPQPRGDPGGVFANADWENGNGNIRIHDLSLDGGAGTGGGRRLYLIAFYKAANVVVERLRLTGASNNDVQIGVAFINSHDFTIKDSYAIGERSACYGVWDGSSRFEIEHNVCDGNDVADGGVVVNGISTAYKSATSYDGKVIGNKISHTRLTGIFVGGLWNGDRAAPVYGDVQEITVEGNSIDGVSVYHGILISDALNVNVRGNSISNVSREAIRVGSQFQGRTKNIFVENNIIKDVDQSSIPDDAIKVTNHSEDVTISNNKIASGNHRFSIRVDPDVRNVHVEGPRPGRGKLGDISDGQALGER